MDPTLRPLARQTADGYSLVDLIQHVAQPTALISRLGCIESVSIGSVRFALRRSAPRAVKSANGPATNGGSLAPLFGPLRGGCATRSFLEGVKPFHGVGSNFFDDPPPPWTLPTMA